MKDNIYASAPKKVICPFTSHGKINLAKVDLAKEWIFRRTEKGQQIISVNGKQQRVKCKEGKQSIGFGIHTTMESSTPLSHFLRDLLKCKHADNDGQEINRVKIVVDNPRITHSRKMFSFIKTDKGASRWGEERSEQSSGRRGQHSLSQPQFARKPPSHPSLQSDSDHEFSYPMRMERNENSCNCESDHCPFCRGHMLARTHRREDKNEEQVDLPPLISLDLVAANMPGERWEEPYSDNGSSVQDTLQNYTIMDDDENDMIPPGLRYSSSSISSNLSTSFSSLPLDPPERGRSSFLSRTDNTRNSFLWGQLDLPEEEEMQLPPLDASENQRSSSSSYQSGSSLSLPSPPRRRSSLYDFEEYST
eukprot:scaffold8070_cov117-Cylindrotheca_fusiformis.AAC.15